MSRFTMRSRSPVLALTSAALTTALTAAAVGVAPFSAAAAGGRGPTTELVSLGANGQSSDPQSGAEGGKLSADGRFVVFATRDPGFATGDTNDSSDVFVRDRRAGTTSRVSLGIGGQQADSDSGGPSISADGRYVAFRSYASNLVAGDTNGWEDGFVHDRRTGRTVRIVSPLADSGTLDVRLSGAGRHVSFGVPSADGTGDGHLMVRDLRTGVTRRVSVDSAGRAGDSGARGAALSSDGSVVAFSSDSTNLVPGDTNERTDVFVHDVGTGHTRRVSTGPRGAQLADPSVAPALSAAGRHVSFSTFAADVVPGDTNGSADVFVRDLRTGRTVIASVDARGRWPGADYMSETSSMLSADGRYVAFTSTFRLVAEDTNGVPDVYVRDLGRHAIWRVSIGAHGEQSAEDSYFIDMSADGRSVSFSSHASNLVPVDTNESSDIFVRGPRQSHGG
jgi:Tol biopolymer transport system component